MTFKYAFVSSVLKKAGKQQQQKHIYVVLCFIKNKINKKLPNSCKEKVQNYFIPAAGFVIWLWMSDERRSRMGWVFQLASLVALLTSTLAGEESGPELPDGHLHLHAGAVDHHCVCSGTK